MTKTVFITGSSSGIGRAAAQLFHAKGWNVVATMRNPNKETELRKLKNLLCLELDITRVETIKKAVDAALNQFGNIDVVVNNAGYAAVGPFEASTQDNIQKQFETNVFGVMNLIRIILPHFRERRSGTIINIASVGGRMTFPIYSLYHASKWALEGFSEGLQHELKPFNIRVRIIEPGPIKTDFYKRSPEFLSKDNFTDYDSYVQKASTNLLLAGEMGASPVVVARSIYKAATAKGWKLRYVPDFKAKGILLLRKILPDSIFSFLIRLVVLK